MMPGASFPELEALEVDAAAEELPPTEALDPEVCIDPELVGPPRPLKLGVPERVALTDAGAVLPPPMPTALELPAVVGVPGLVILAVLGPVDAGTVGGVE